MSTAFGGEDECEDEDEGVDGETGFDERMAEYTLGSVSESVIDVMVDVEDMVDDTET